MLFIELIRNHFSTEVQEYKLKIPVGNKILKFIQLILNSNLAAWTNKFHIIPIAPGSQHILDIQKLSKNILKPYKIKFALSNKKTIIPPILLGLYFLNTL